MRTLNVRLAIILLVIIVVGGAGVTFIHYIQQYRNAYFFLEQANIAKQEVEDAKKEKKTEEQAKALQTQIKNLQWYLSFRPNDLDVTEELGLLLADHIIDGTTFNPVFFNQAMTRLDAVVREDPTRNNARRKLIDLQILYKTYTDAMEHIQYLLKESPDNPELLQLLGQCQQATRDYQNAQKSYEKAIEYSPKQIETYPQLANLLRQSLDKSKEAYTCMQNLVKNNPDSTKAYVYLGSYWESMDTEEAKKASGKDDIDPKEEALKAAEKAVELSPDDQDALLLAARCSTALNKSEQARKYTEHNLKIHKDSPVIYTTLAEIIVRAGDKEKAIDILNQGLKETKNSPQILWYKANFLIDLRKMDDAHEAIVELQTAQYPKPLTDYLEARMAFAQKDWAEAARRFEKVRPSLISSSNLLKQADLSLGYCYGQLHNVDQEINAYQRVVKIDPFSLPPSSTC
ncbi:MAG: tetratricopeptide repeat protein [Thermoguttaceae bacterium]